MRGDQVEPLPRREQLGHAGVERGVVGVDHHLQLGADDLLQHSGEVVVHGTADERDPQGHVTSRTPLMPPSSRSVVPVVKVLGAARYATASATSSVVTSRPSGCRRRNAS